MNNKKRKKKNKNEIEQMTAEEAFGYYFIAGFTEGGAPYGISMEEAEEQGLLDEPNTNQSTDDMDMPF